VIFSGISRNPEVASQNSITVGSNLNHFFPAVMIQNTAWNKLQGGFYCNSTSMMYAQDAWHLVLTLFTCKMAVINHQNLDKYRHAMWCFQTQLPSYNMLKQKLVSPIQFCPNLSFLLERLVTLESGAKNWFLLWKIVQFDIFACTCRYPWIPPL
jgi:hypothetical protein